MVNKDQILKLVHKHFKTTGEVHVDDQGKVSCTGNVEWTSNRHKLSVQFDRVERSFFCSFRNLTTLAGCPAHVGGHFSCTSNKLTNLTHGPQFVGAGYDCGFNQLTSLVGAPALIEGGTFNCRNNKLQDLSGAPHTVAGEFVCSANPLINLEHAPHSVKGNFVCTYTAQLPLLRLLNYKNINLLYAPQPVQEVLHKYKDRGKKAALACAAELVKAGYKDNARW